MAGAGVLLIGALALISSRAAFTGSITRIGADLSHPDVLIRSQHLSQLPKDLAQAPLLRQLLTHDLVNYYEDHPTRLSLLGTLRRLAFDHELNWAQNLLVSALDSPAEVAFWRDGRGHPEHFVAVVEHGVLASSALQLAEIALPDKQLSVAGTLAGTTLYALKLNARQTFLIASVGRRTLVVSDPGLLMNEDGVIVREAENVLSAALKTKNGQASPFAKDFGLDVKVAAPSQQIVARVDYLSFGYQHFFPMGQALRAERNAKGQWQTYLRSDAKALDGWRASAAHLTQALPRGAAFCATVPLDTQRVGKLLATIDTDAAKALAAELEPSAAVCWGAVGGVYNPLLAMRLKNADGAHTNAALAVVFERGTRQPLAAEATAAKAAPKAAAMQLQEPKVPVGTKIWTRAVHHEFGTQALSGVDAGPGNVLAMARVGKTLLLTTDRRMLDSALAVASKTYPTWGDEARALNGTPLMSLNGPVLAQLLESESFRVLRQAEATAFIRVARELWTPKLKALSQVGNLQLGLPGVASVVDEQGWLELTVLQTAQAKSTP